MHVYTHTEKDLCKTQDPHFNKISDNLALCSVENYFSHKTYNLPTQNTQSNMNT